MSTMSVSFRQAAIQRAAEQLDSHVNRLVTGVRYDEKNCSIWKSCRLMEVLQTCRPLDTTRTSPGGCMNWSGLFMALFLAAGCLSALTAVFFRIMAGRLAGINPMGATLTSLMAGRRERIGWIKNLTNTVLEVVPYVVTWPAMYIAFRGRRSTKKVVELRLQWPLDLIVSAWLLAFSVLVAFLVGASGVDWPLQAACYSIVAATIAIPAHWVIDGSNLREELRRTVHNPMAQFLFISAANFVALSIGATVLVRTMSHSAFKWASVWPEALQILRFGHLSAIWQARPTRIPEILLAGAALAAYALLIGQLSKPWLFRRSDDDRIDIALRLLLADDGDGAERWLDSVQSNNPEIPTLVRVHGMLAIKTGQFGLALQHAKAIASLRRQRMLPIPPEDDDDGRRVLAEWAEFFIRADYGELHSRVVDYLITDGISDPCLATVVPALLSFDISKQRIGTLGAWLMRQSEQARRLAEATGKPDARLEALAHETAKPPEFPSAITDPPYPLALGMREGLMRQLPEAAVRLLAMRRSRQAPVRIVKRILSGHLIVEAAVQSGHRSRSREAATQEVLGLFDEVQNWPLATIPWWLREWLQDETTQWLELMRLMHQKRMIPALQELHAYLVRPRNANEFKAKAIAAANSAGRESAVNVARTLKTISSRRPESSMDPDEPRIIDGPDATRSPVSATHYVFRYCVKRKWRHHDIYVYIDKGAPKYMINTAGQAALEATLSQGETPGRIFISSSGKVTRRRVADMRMPVS